MVQVNMREFLRVAVFEREKYPTCEEAAAVLGMKVSSYRQKVQRARVDYPNLFRDVPYYKRGRKKYSEQQLMKMAADLQRAKRKRRQAREAANA